MPAAMPVNSAASSRPSTSSSSVHASQASTRVKQVRQPIDDLGADEDAEGEIDDEFLQLLPPSPKPPPVPAKKLSGRDTSTAKGKQVAASRKAVNASSNAARPDDDSEPEEALLNQIRFPPQSIPAPAPAPAPVPAPAPKAKAPSKPARQKKSAAMTKAEKAALAASTAFRSFPKPRPSQLPAAAAPPASTPSTIKSFAPTAAAKREREAEELAPEAPATVPAPQPRKRQKVAQPVAAPKPEKPKEPFSLALPTGSEFNLPGSVSAPALAGGSSRSGNASPPDETAPTADDSEEEDWMEVQPSASAPAIPTASQPQVRDIQMEVVIPEATRRPEPQEPMDGSDGLAAGEEDFLQDMFDEAAEEEVQEDDFLQDAYGESQPSVSAPPLSMNDLAKETLGDTLWGDDDDDTSEDSESDDE